MFDARIALAALVLVASVMAGGCEHSRDHGEQAHGEHGHGEHPKHSHAHGEDAPAAPRLDDGKRWHANPETTAGIERLRAITAGAVGATSGAATPETVKSTGKQLRDAYQAVFKECTMKGEG